MIGVATTDLFTGIDADAICPGCVECVKWLSDHQTEVVTFFGNAKARGERFSGAVESGILIVNRCTVSCDGIVVSRDGQNLAATEKVEIEGDEAITELFGFA